MLFLRELKKVIFSISYVLFVIVTIAALYSQDALNFGGSKMDRPQPGGNYGTTQKEIPEIIMPAALKSLWGEFCENNYKTYPVGFIKNVKLNDREQREMAGILSEITGVDIETLMEAGAEMPGTGNNEFVIGADGNMQMVQSPDRQELTLTVRSDMDYSEFRDLMQQADDILGGGSDYSAKSLTGFGAVPVSYEEAVQRYDLCLSRDKITGGYARLFSDYATAMVMSILPVFPAVLMCMKDRRAKMAEMIYTRKVSAAKVIVSRYLAVITAVMIPVVILSLVSNSSVWGMYGGAELDYLAPVKYDLGWILPSVMMAAALGMCLTELTNTPIAVAVQGFWWLMDVNAGIQSVSDSYALFRLAPRHNAGEMSCFRTQDYIDNFQRLVMNRLMFAGLALILVLITIVIYEANRKGKLNGNFKFKKALSDLGSRKNKSEA